MLALFSLGLFLSIPPVLSEDGKCRYALEVLQIQDGSSSFLTHVEQMKKTTQQLMTSLTETFGDLKYGVSSFVDKPMPTRGIGPYGNMEAFGYTIDWCFHLHTPLCDDQAAIAQGLGDLGSHMGNGGDFPEAPYEGFVRAAYSKSAGWSDPSVTHTQAGRPIARLALLITDDIPHYALDAVNGATNAWGAARTYADPNNSSGGFGSRVWGTLANVIFYKTDEDHRDYLEMSDLFKLVDFGKVLSAEQEARLDALIKKFGPYPWPEIKDHPGDDSMDCNITEYPSLTQVADALNKFKITPIVLVAQPSQISRETSKHCAAMSMTANVDCIVATYQRDFSQVGISAVVKSLVAQDVTETIVKAIGDATDDLCQHSTTPPPPPVIPPTEPTATTQTEPATTEPTTSTETEPATTTETEPATTTETEPATTTEPEPTTTPTDPATTETEPATKVPATTGSEEKTSISTMTSSSTEEEASSSSTTGGSSGTPVGVIAGATGGAVAGLAGVGGLLYKKFGMSLFGGGDGAGAANIAQVDVPESPVEREMLEEVSMDMFQ